MNISDLYKIFRKCGTVSTDSRTLKGGELFFALKGENFDGNRYALGALDAGAAYAVVSDSTLLKDSPKDEEGNDRLILVEDTLKALQDLARWHRSMTFVGGKPLTVIALTGTNGKTTTKELVRAVLSVKYNVTATEGNLNNSIGVPLTLLKINDKTEIAIVEMGASHPGDIKELVSVALPNYGLITNVGKAHLLGFGSFEGVKKTKGELYDYIQRTADKVFINADNPHLCEMASERPDLQQIRYGMDYCGAKVLPSSPEHPYLRLTLSSDGGEILIETHLVGAYNADNVIAAIAVGRHFGVPVHEAAKAIGNYIPSNNRSQLTRTGSNVLIVDAYNANPTSMDAALDNFAAIEAEHKAVFLGNMLELGDDSQKEHEAVVRKLAGMNLDLAVLVGEEFIKAVCSAGEQGNGTFVCFATSVEAADYLRGNPLRNHCVLVKGSRGTRMETVVPVL